MNLEDRVNELELRQGEVINALKAIMSNSENEKLKRELERIIRIIQGLEP